MASPLLNKAIDILNQLDHVRQQLLEKLSDPVNDSTQSPALSPYPSNSPDASGKKAGEDKKCQPKYSTEQKKRAAILAITLNNNRLAAIQLNPLPEFKTLNESTIRYWRRELAEDAEIVRQTEIHKRKKQVRGTKAFYQDEEIKIMEEFVTRRKKGLAVKVEDLRSMALKFIKDPVFRASNGWLRNFLKRHGLSFRSCTHAIQKIIEDYPSLVSKLLEQVRALRFKYEDQKEEGKTRVVVFNMDETPLEFDLTSKRTYDFVGRREVSLIRTK
jgi:hypothetical protein